MKKLLITISLVLIPFAIWLAFGIRSNSFHNIDAYVPVSKKDFKKQVDEQNKWIEQLIKRIDELELKSLGRQVNTDHLEMEKDIEIENLQGEIEVLAYRVGLNPNEVKSAGKIPRSRTLYIMGNLEQRIEAIERKLNRW